MSAAPGTGEVAGEVVLADPDTAADAVHRQLAAVVPTVRRAANTLPISAGRSLVGNLLLPAYEATISAVRLSRSESLLLSSMLQLLSARNQISGPEANGLEPVRQRHSLCEIAAALTVY
jgi:hypothetical protein